MKRLPVHGRINCTRCFDTFNKVEFDSTRRTEAGWRITANPLAWGNENPKVIVLGFSKGPTQAGALANTPHDEIAYKGSRHNVGEILAHIGVLPSCNGKKPGEIVSEAIADRTGLFHFGSLIRCTVERHDEKEVKWKGSGGGMLDKFVATDFGQDVARNCTEEFLSRLPENTKLIVMFGLGTSLNYVNESFKLYKSARGGDWTWLNEVAYSDGKIVVVHVEHFASQGRLIPQWLGELDHERSKYGVMAQEAVKRAGVSAGHEMRRDIPASVMKKTTLTVGASVAHAPKSSVVVASDRSAAQIDLATIITEVKKAGYTPTNTTVKLAEFKSPSGQKIYLVTSPSRLSSIKLMVHPGLKRHALSELAGVESVSAEHRFHSNMTQFPKRLNKGVTETAYGWQVSVSTIADLRRFLS